MGSEIIFILFLIDLLRKVKKRAPGERSHGVFVLCSFSDRISLWSLVFGGDVLEPPEGAERRWRDIVLEEF